MLAVEHKDDHTGQYVLVSLSAIAGAARRLRAVETPAGTQTTRVWVDERRRVGSFAYPFWKWWWPAQTSGAGINRCVRSVL